MSITKPDIFYPRFQEYSYEQVNAILYGKGNAALLKILRVIRQIVLALFIVSFLWSRFWGHRSTLKTSITRILFLLFVALFIYIRWTSKGRIKRIVGNKYDTKKLEKNILSDKTYETLSQNFTDLRGFSYENDAGVKSAYGVPAWFYEQNGFSNTALVDRLDDVIRSAGSGLEVVSETNELKIAASYNGVEFYYSSVLKEAVSGVNLHVLANLVTLASNGATAAFNISEAGTHYEGDRIIHIGRKEYSEYIGPDKKTEKVAFGGLIFEHANPMIKGTVEFVVKDKDVLKIGNSIINYKTGNKQFDDNIKIYSETDGVEEIRSFLTPQMIQALLSVISEGYFYYSEIIATNRYIIVLKFSDTITSSFISVYGEWILTERDTGDSESPIDSTIDYFIKYWIDAFSGTRKLTEDRTPTLISHDTQDLVPQRIVSPVSLCRQCGAELKPGNLFCAKCGAKVE